MSRDELLGVLSHDNLLAFLRVIREGESSQDDDAFTVMFGGGHFESFTDHPRTKNAARLGGKLIYSTAAGAYQFLATTWDEMAKRYDLANFSPLNQNIAAVGLIQRRGALEDVIAGRLNEALSKCSREWASLPGSPFGQPTLTREKAAEVYATFGGRIASPDRSAQPASPPVVAPTAQPAKGGFMAPLVIPILSALSSLIPQLGQLFGSGSEVANRNIAAGTILAKTITEATQSVNLQEAAEKIQADAEMQRAAQAAVAEVWSTVVEGGGGGIEGARKAAMTPDGDWRKVVFTFPFMFAAVLVPLIYAVVLAAIVKAPWLVEFTPDARMMVVTAIINLALGSLIGYAYGTTLGSQKKDSIIAGGKP